MGNGSDRVVSRNHELLLSQTGTPRSMENLKSTEFRASTCKGEAQQDSDLTPKTTSVLDEEMGVRCFTRKIEIVSFSYVE